MQNLVRIIDKGRLTSIPWFHIWFFLFISFFRCCFRFFIFIRSVWTFDCCYLSSLRWALAVPSRSGGVFIFPTLGGSGSSSGGLFIFPIFSRSGGVYFVLVSNSSWRVWSVLPENACFSPRGLRILIVTGRPELMALVYFLRKTFGLLASLL